MKNIIAIVSTVFIIGLMVYTFSNGRAFQGGEAGNIIEDMKYIDTPKTVETVETKEQKNEDEEKLKALRDKAGNSGTFEVSNAYKSKCASCHGVDGSGEQNGKKLMGPKLIGQEEAVLYKDLVDFKAGRKENLIMKGLLINLEDEDLKNFAKEIAGFKAKQEALNQ
ncbi:monoheme c-type cytochrome [Arcobacter acticola]|jgi:cytochrome c553|uniref:Monoheme c-type cytochrome n=1 Tax=Arcobacter acticola TaxID=1849015 RepID=A0A6M8EQD0_9BACT|nr:c-type cytochrome [Arcobacter acticola]QKE29301.1 monoheme c-type cytochrome [Arcobacter acticola]